MDGLRSNLTRSDKVKRSLLGKDLGLTDRCLHGFTARPVDTSFLPKIIHSFAEVIGMSEAVKIAAMVSAKGRRVSIYFPSNLSERHVLRGVVSDEALLALCKIFRHETVNVYPCKNWGRGLLKQQMQNLYAKRFRHKEIAGILNVCLMTVYRELSRKSKNTA